jgi:valyl-tRNA synthetase
MAKPRLQAKADDGHGAATTRAVLSEVLRTLLRMLHPMMPFITEELWWRIPGNKTHLAVSAWPALDESMIDPDVEERMALLQQLVVKIRNLRAESNIDPARRIEVQVQVDAEDERVWLAEHGTLVAQLARAGETRLVTTVDEKLVAARGVAGPFHVAIPLEGLLDLDAERSRLRNELTKLEKELAGRTRRLANREFLDRAPASVVDKERRIEQELRERYSRLDHSLQLLTRAPGS